MRGLAVLLLFAWPAALAARPLALVAEWEEPVLSATRASLVKPGAVLVLPDTQGSERCSNAVLFARGLAITARHCIQKDGRRLRRILVEGRPARLTATVADLAVLSVDGAIAGKPAKVRAGAAVVLPRPGAKLLHEWWDHRTGKADRRVVTWDGQNAIREGFTAGMSGSGLYALTGHLVAIAQRADGLVLGPLEIAELLRIREMRNVE